MPLFIYSLFWKKIQPGTNMEKLEENNCCVYRYYFFFYVAADDDVVVAVTVRLKNIQL